MEFKKSINTGKFIAKYILHCLITIPLFCIPFSILIINISKLWATIWGLMIMTLFISLFIPYIILMFKYLIDIIGNKTETIEDLTLENVSSQRFLCAIMVNRKFIQEILSSSYTLVINLHIKLLNKPLKLILYISKNDFYNSQISKIIFRNVVGNYEYFMLTDANKKFTISATYLKNSKIIKNISIK